MTDELRVTPLEQWLPQAEITRLPSGRVVKLRPSLSVLNCLAEGRIPNPLRKVAMDVASGGMDADEVMEHPDQAAQFINWIVSEMVVEPKLWHGKGKQPADSVPVKQFHQALNDADRLTIVNRAFQGVSALESFREE